MLLSKKKFRKFLLKELQGFEFKDLLFFVSDIKEGVD